MYWPDDGVDHVAAAAGDDDGHENESERTRTRRRRRARVDWVLSACFAVAVASAGRPECLLGRSDCVVWYITYSFPMKATVKGNLLGELVGTLVSLANSNRVLPCLKVPLVTQQRFGYAYIRCSLFLRLLLGFGFEFRLICRRSIQGFPTELKDY